MWKKFIKNIFLIIIPMAISLAFLYVYNRHLDNQIVKNYNPALARTFGVDEMNEGIKLLSNNANKGDIILLGSSELDSTEIPQHARNFFPNSELNCDIVLTGRAYCQSLTNSVKIGALSENFRGKKIVLLVSPPWFYSQEIDASGYCSNFSEIQFYKFMNNSDISADIKKYACERTCKLTKNESSLNEIRMYSYLYSKNEFSKFCLNFLKPYYFVREKFIELKDKHMALKAINKFKDKPLQKVKNINWRAEEIKAQKMGEENCTNNSLYIMNDLYTNYVKPIWDSENTKKSFENINLLNSNELSDFEMFLKLCKDCNVDVYVMFTPVNGFYHDHFGLNRQKRATFYDEAETLASKYGFDYLDMREKEYEPYFMKDSQHLGWKGWLYINEKITEYFK